MTGSSSPFHFDASPISISPAVVADVPSGIRTKEALFDELAQRLRFPDYFGANWDALWECVRDLSWLPAGPVVLRHSDLPLAQDVANLKKYLSILSDAVEKRWAMPNQNLRDLVVAFPPEAREKVAWLLRSSAHDEGECG